MRRITRVSLRPPRITGLGRQHSSFAHATRAPMLPVWLRRSTSPPPARVDPRAREWSLLLANGPVVLLASGAIAAGQAEPLALFPAALAVLASVWFACLALHGFLRLLRFDGDPLFLPLVSLLFLVGTAYHTDVPSLQPGRFSPSSYTVAVWIGLGALGAIVALGSGFGRISRWFEERVWWRVCGDRPYYPSIPFHILLIGLMCLLGVLLLFGGVEKDGGALIQVPVGFGFTITPSEFIRLAVAYFLADYLGRNSQLLRGLREPIGRVWPFNRVFLEPRVELTVVVVTVGLYLGFFYLFKDFGPAAVIVVLTLLALYAATGRVLTPLLLGAGLTGAVGFFTWQHIAFHTFGRRVSMWLEPWEATFYHGDHLARILWAIASGGWFGMGVGTERLGARLPLAHNDAAFAGVAATMGLWTGLCVLALFAALTWRGMAVARAAPTDRMRLLALCLTLLLGFQALWICGAMVRVFPFTGINLPFIST
ncbi:MAG: FtsW/RodA/SpoVE family cell cycle protein, partial [Armatimonadetes bacterium]|nr:FtsW/RodA/SpoVE family cell cycle protein [Armatimonadota bacterium]